MQRISNLPACVMAVALGGAVTAGPAAAQRITIDGTMSPAQTLIGPNYTIGANLGKQVGGNLFQSFGIFGLSNGESATFTGPATVTNVIGRVTGGSQSSVNGAINSSITGANVYLINPAGTVFGPNATINVSGSFRAATADYLKTADGAKFQATNPAAARSPPRRLRRSASSTRRRRRSRSTAARWRCRSARRSASPAGRSTSPVVPSSRRRQGRST